MRQLGHILHAHRQAGDAVEIRTQADIIRAHELDYVIDVCDQVIQGGRRQRIFGVHLVPHLAPHAEIAVIFIADLGQDQVGALAPFGIQKGRAEVDHDHTAVLRQGLNHLIAHVARHVADGAAGAVRGDHRRFRDAHHVGKRRIRNMGNVDDHAGAVHLADHLLSQFVQAVPFRLIGGGVGPVRGFGVGQSDVADAQAVEHTQHRRAVLQGVAALQTHERSDFAFGSNALHVRSGEGQLQAIRVFRCGAVHHIHHFHGALRAAVLQIVHRNVHREELAVEAAFTHARQILVTVWQALADVDAFLQHARGEIGMAVDDNGLPVDFQGLLPKGIVRFLA